MKTDENNGPGPGALPMDQYNILNQNDTLLYINNQWIKGARHPSGFFFHYVGENQMLYDQNKQPTAWKPL